MLVTVQLRGLLFATAGFRQKQMEIPEGTDVGALFKLLGLPVSGAWTRASVNGNIKGNRYVLSEGDTVLFFPVGGGG